MTTIETVWETALAAVEHAERIKHDDDQPQPVMERAQAQADAWRAVLLLIREDDAFMAAHKDPRSRNLMDGALSTHREVPMLCPLDRTLFDFRLQDMDKRRYVCERGHQWDHDWMHSHELRKPRVARPMEPLL